MNSRNVYWSYIVSLREISRVLIWLALSPTHPPRRGHLTERGGESSRTALLLWRDFKTSMFWSKWFIHPEQSGDGTPPIHPYLAEGQWISRNSNSGPSADCQSLPYGLILKQGNVQVPICSPPPSRDRWKKSEIT